MSNHFGSQMLNQILLMMEKEGVFEGLGKEKSRKIVKRITEIGEGYGG